MKVPRLIAVAGALTGVVIIIRLALPTYWQTNRFAIRDPSKLVQAVHAYLHDQTEKGGALPDLVPLPHLIAGGYISPADVRAFDGIDIKISPKTATPSRPQQILIQARLPDGRVVGVIGDGSLSDLSR